MTPEDTIVCLCTRQHFEATHIQKLITICQNQTIQWDEVFDTAERHDVAPLVHTNLAKPQNGSFAVPQAVMNKFKKAYIHNVFVKKGTGPILEEALALFAQNGIDVMLVKGVALNVLVYEKPWYTRSYDVDLVIKAHRDEIDEADHSELIKTLEEFNHQRNEFKEHIEYDYYEHHDVTMNNVLAINPERLWREAHKVQVNGHDVFVMTPEDMLLAAAINSCRKRFFRLKALCDIAEIIHHYPDLNWDLVADKAIEYQCNTILYTALVVTQTTLGCPLPEDLLSALKVNLMRAVVIKHLVKNLCQNFTLTELFERSENTLLGREFSWPLVLTYTVYRANHIVPKMVEIYRAFGGFYWEVDSSGEVAAMSAKHLVGQAFGIYALSEYALASGDDSATALVGELFNLLESRAHDAEYGGYRECFLRDWSSLPKNSKNIRNNTDPTIKTVDTHLHLMEGITLYYRLIGEPLAEVLEAVGLEQVRIWMKYHLLEPRFDNPNARMPNQGLTQKEASQITNYLLIERGQKDSFLTRFRNEVLPQMRPRHLLFIFVGGFFIGILFTVLTGYVIKLQLTRHRKLKANATS